MQLDFEFIQPAVESENVAAYDPNSSAKETLENFINVCGLVAYKDFFMKIKNGFASIPDGLSQNQYLMLAREVYVRRAAMVNRTKNRSKFFAVRNRIKSHKKAS
jgi:hypothetical protein